MARISGVDLPREKRIEIGLTYVYGIGRATSNRLLKEAGVNPDTRVRDLTDEEVSRITAAIDRHSSQKGTSRPRTEDKDQCENSQGPEKDSSKQEEISIFDRFIQEVIRQWLRK